MCSLMAGGEHADGVDAGGATGCCGPCRLVVNRANPGAAYDPRRHRGEAPRPCTDIQGRTIREITPGQEQPADSWLRAAPAGRRTANAGARGADRSVRRVSSIALVMTSCRSVESREPDEVTTGSCRS